MSQLLEVSRQCYSNQGVCSPHPPPRPPTRGPHSQPEEPIANEGEDLQSRTQT